MIVIKVIFIVFMMLYTMHGIANSIGSIAEEKTVQESIINIIEIGFGVMMTFVIYKI